MDKPILFLDVDGVLNAFPEGAERYDNPEKRVKNVTELGVTYVPVGTRERVHLLLEHFDPIWSTAWRGSAHAHHRNILGLSEIPWPYVDYERWKIPEMVRMAEGRPWCFIDDDVEWELRELDLRGAWREIPDTLTIRPLPRIGLTDEHVEQAIAFAREHS